MEKEMNKFRLAFADTTEALKGAALEDLKRSLDVLIAAGHKLRNKVEEELERSGKLDYSGSSERQKPMRFLLEDWLAAGNGKNTKPTLGRHGNLQKRRKK